MKKILLLSSLFLMGFGAFSQFTKNRLVVTQYGDGIATLSTTKTVPIILKEFKPVLDNSSAENSPTRSIPLPIAIDGSNFPLTGLVSNQYEGLLTLSANGQLLTLIGYGLAPNATVVAADGSLRVIATINILEAINSSSNLVGSSNNLGNPRCVFTTDGTFFWGVGDSGGLRYKVANNAATTSSVTGTPSTFRSMTVFNNKLYGASTAGGGPRVSAIAKGADNLPIAGSSVSTALPGLGTTTLPNQLLFFRMTGTGDPDLLYLTSDGTNAIEKWVLNTGLNTWEKKGEVVTSDAPKGITGQIDRLTNKAYIYASSNTRLFSFEDADFANSSLATLTNTVTTIATAPANTQFRGVALTPTSTVLPIKLTSFIGSQEQQTVKLTWSTASETNNERFEVWKSVDGKSFDKLGTVIGNQSTTNSNTYSLTDRNPANGINYYQLKQIDNDGNSETFKTISVKVSLTNPKINAYFSNEQLEVNLYAANAGQASIVLSSISGRKIVDTKTNVAQGYSVFKTPISDLQPGVYVVTITIDGVNHSIKLIK